MKYIYTFFALLISLGSYAQPTTDAPVPDKDAANVVSVFSDSYTNIATNYNPFWGQAGTVNTEFKITGSNNNILLYASANFQGTDLTSTDLSTFEFLHVDIWVAAGTDKMIKITPVAPGSESLQPITLTPGSWSSVDLPKSSFTGMNWTGINQMKVDAQFDSTGAADPSGVDIYFDNIYFWKEPTVEAEDATLSALTVDGTSVNSFDSATTSYSVDLPMGTTVVPTVAATASVTGATVSITQAPSIPGDATVLVTSSSGNTVETYTVSFIENAPSTSAPTPPARAAADVASIMSPDYDDIQFAEYFPVWCIGTVTDYMVGADKTWKVSGFEKIAVADYGAPKDLSSINSVHLDLWTLDYSGADNITLELNDTVNTQNSASIEIGTITGGDAWQSIDFDLTAAKGTKDWSSITQIILVTNNTKRKTIYFDNFYFYDDGSAGGGGGETPTTTTYCDTEVTHLNIAAETPSKILLTIENSDADKITVTAESVASTIDLLEVNSIVGGGTASPATITNGVATIDITWSAGSMPATTTFNILWSDITLGGNWMVYGGTSADQLGDIDTANDCSTQSVKDISFYNIDVYPNPASNVINVRSEFTIDNLSVLDLMGRTVKQQISNNKEFSLDVSDLVKGVYLVKLSSGEKEAVTKFIKK